MASEKTDDLFQTLERAVSGAVYVSETDSTPEPFFIEAASDASDKQIMKQVTGSVGRPVKTTDAEDLFQRLTEKKDWHSEAEELNRRRFERIHRLFAENLTDIRVIKAGTIRIDIIVCGRASGGAVCGIWMKAVET